MIDQRKPRPVRRFDVRRINNYRIPERGPLTPRLREPESNLHLVGFHRDYVEQSNESDD